MVDAPKEVPQQQPQGNAAMATAASQAYGRDVVVPRGGPMNVPGAFGDVSIAGAMPKAFAEVNAQFGPKVATPEESRLLQEGQTAKAYFDPNLDASKADVILEKGKPPILNTSLDKPLSELNIKTGAGVTEQDQEAFLKAVEKQWGTKPVVAKGDDLTDANGGNTTPPNDGSNGGDCSDGTCPKPKPGPQPPVDNSTDNNLNPTDNTTPTPKPNDGGHRTISDDAAAFSKAAAETHSRTGDKGVVNSWFTSRLPASVLAQMANMTPEELADFLKNNPDIAKAKEEMEAEAKSRRENGDTAGADEMDKFAKNLTNPDAKFSESLQAYAKASQNGQQPSAEIVNGLMSQGLQKAVVSGAADSAAKQLVNESGSPYKGVDISKNTSSAAEATTMSDLYKAATEKLKDQAFVDGLFKKNGTTTQRLVVPM
jgi:hypothetical protein